MLCVDAPAVDSRMCGTDVGSSALLLVHPFVRELARVDRLLDEVAKREEEEIHSADAVCYHEIGEELEPP